MEGKKVSNQKIEKTIKTKEKGRLELNNIYFK